LSAATLFEIFTACWEPMTAITLPVWWNVGRAPPTLTPCLSSDSHVCKMAIISTHSLLPCPGAQYRVGNNQRRADTLIVCFHVQGLNIGLAITRGGQTHS